MERDLAALPVKDGFRLRGTSVSRLETFVDAAFAFGVTLLVISVGSMPKSVHELTQALHSVPVFVVCFWLLTRLWSGHDEWSRRYGLEGTATHYLSLLFVLVMLVWVYPLRMVMSGGLWYVTGGWVPSEMDIGDVSELQDCFVIYGVGYLALNAILLRLHRAALSDADALELNPIERLETRREIGVYAIHVGVALLSIVLTFFLRHSNTWVMSLSGFVYALVGPLLHWHHARFHGLRARLATG